MTIAQDWAATPLAGRLAIVRRFRHAVAADPRPLARAAARPRASEADILVAEVAPLLEACRFLEREAAAILAPRRQGARGRPVWLFGTDLVVRRIPFGTVLVLAPSNYPLFLPGVQVLHALVAGNAVAVKPAPGCSGPMTLTAARLADAGLPPGVLEVLGETLDDAGNGMARADKVFLTGGVETGRAVLAALAPRLVPAVMELSGADRVVVLPGADLALVAAAVAYGLALNGGATCIAPRRILAVGEVGAALRPLLAGVAGLVEGAAGAPPPALFGRAADIVDVADADAAVAEANAGPYALGAAVFGPAAAAAGVAARLRAGCVVVNDLIVPTADPRLPFGGGGWSGFGTTRGAEGLLECTRVQAVMTRTRPSTRHLRVLDGAAAPLVARLLALGFGAAGLRLRRLRG